MDEEILIIASVGLVWSIPFLLALSAFVLALRNRRGLKAVQARLEAPPVRPGEARRPAAERSAQAPAIPAATPAPAPAAPPPPAPATAPEVRSLENLASGIWPPEEEAPEIEPAEIGRAERGPWRGRDWEQWLGLRGAAVAGGVLLALAGLYFFRYSVEQEWLSPLVRVLLGVGAGVTAVLASAVVRRRGHGPAANALVGGGAATLFASFWASYHLYGLVSAGWAFFLLTLVTALCGLLADRHRSRLVAVLGVSAGFLTPILITPPFASPLAYLAYVLLLAAALLVLAHRQRWPTLGTLGLVATMVHLVLYFLQHDDAPGIRLGMGAMAAWALLFAAAARLARPAVQRTPAWRVTQTGALLLPLALTLLLVVVAGTPPGLALVGGLLLVFAGLGCTLGRQLEAGWLAALTAGAAAVVFTARLHREWPVGGEAWLAAGLAVALAGIFQLAARRDRGELTAGLTPAAWVAGLGLFPGLVVDRGAGSPWPWLVSWLGLAVLFGFQARLPGRGAALPLAAAGLGLGLVAGPALPGPGTFLAVAGGLCAALLALAEWRRGAPWGRWAAHAAALLPCAALAGFLASPWSSPADLGWALPAALLFGAVTARAALLLGPSIWYGVATVLGAVVPGALVLAAPEVGSAPALLGWGLAAAAALSFLPWLGRAPLGSRAFTCWAAAAAAPCWVLALRRLFLQTPLGVVEPRALGLLALALAGLAAAAGWLVVQRAGRRRGAAAPFWGVALGFVTLAAWEASEGHLLTLLWAAEALAVAWLWRRRPGRGLEALSAGLFAAVALRLVVNPAILGFAEGFPFPAIGEILWAYLLPAGLALAGWRVFGGGRGGFARGRIVCAVSAVAVLFAWVNATIFAGFGTGHLLRLGRDRTADLDLALSLGWALYALALLGLGLWRAVPGLRRAGLLFLLAALGKVFLYDLRELTDLYRVGSLLGLALSLLLVSTAYQRLVRHAAGQEVLRPRPAGTD